IESVPRADLGELPCQLDPLRLSAAQSGAGLSQPQIAEAHIDQRLQISLNSGKRVEEGARLVDVHVEDVRYVLLLLVDLERFTVVATAVALFAVYIDVRQEVHLDLADPVPSAGLAPSSFHIEGEAALVIPPDSGLRQLGEKEPNLIEHLCIGTRIGARGPAD